MKAKFSLLCRVGSAFVPVEIKKGTPIAPANAGSYYARFSQDGKRISKPLGKNLTDAFVAFRNLEMVREYEKREMPVPVMMAPVTSTTSRETIAAEIDTYLNEVDNDEDLAYSTYVAYRSSLKSFTESCKKIHLYDLTREDILKFKADLREQGLEPRSVYNDCLNVRIFLKWAGVKIQDLDSKDWPARPKDREPEEYTSEEIEAMLLAANYEERLLIRCFLCSGMRSGELAHFTYNDIDWKHSIWTVQAKNGWEPKNQKAHRDIPVPKELTEKLRCRMVAGRRAKTDLVFFNSKGDPNRHFLEITKRVAKRAKVTGRVDDHKFRSTAITRWLRAGNSIPDVMNWVGHSDPKIIMYYAAKMNLRKPEMHDKATGAFTEFSGVGD